MHIILSNTAGEALYEQIKNQIKSQILSGSLSEGDLLPSIRALAKDLEVSVITTKRAYDDLESEGFICTIPGKGTYIAVQDAGILREQQLKTVEEKLVEAIHIARGYRLEDDILKQLFHLLLEEE